MNDAKGNFPWLISPRNGSMLPGGQWGDVNGDGVPDHVYLTGVAAPNSPYITQLSLHVKDGRSGATYSIKLKEDAGYNPTIFLGRFTDDKPLDILVSIDSGGSGGFTYDELFSFAGNHAVKLYDNEWYFQTYSDTSVVYEDNYKVKVTNRSLALQFIIDISGRDADYLNGIYQPDGKLKQPTQGAVSIVNGVYPIDLQRDGQYELWIFQRITGLYNADGLGYLQTPLQWNKDRNVFVPLYQWASIYGNDYSAGR